MNKIISVFVALVLSTSLALADESLISIKQYSDEQISQSNTKSIAWVGDGVFAVKGQMVQAHMHLQDGVGGAVKLGGKDYFGVPYFSQISFLDENIESAGMSYFDPQTRDLLFDLERDGKMTVYKNREEYPAVMKIGDSVTLNNYLVYEKLKDSKPSDKGVTVLTLRKQSNSEDGLELCEIAVEYNKDTKYKKVDSVVETCKLFTVAKGLQGFSMKVRLKDADVLFRGDIRVDESK